VLAECTVAERRKHMRGIHRFENQVDGIRWMADVIVRASYKGSVDGAEELFLAAIRNRVCGLREWWQYAVHPVLEFYQAMNVDGATTTLFDWDVADVADGHGFGRPQRDRLQGEISWRGQGTRGRFAHLTLGKDGSAVLRYDLGYLRGTEGEVLEEKTSSTFLDLPAEGDEAVTMGREEWYNIVFLARPTKREEE
jgi:hypothetical protein